MDVLPFSLVILLHFLINSSHRVSALKTIYVADECNKLRQTSPKVQYLDFKIGSSMEPDSSGILKASAYGGYVGNLNCKITLNHQSAGGFILSFRTIDFRPNCIDNITVSRYSSFYPSVYCHSINDPMEYKFHDSTGSMYITFQTGENDAPSSFDGFELVYTRYTIYVDPLCTESSFQCSKGCIWKGFRCDGHNHCGDRRDQENCTMTTEEVTTEKVAEMTRSYDRRDQSKEKSGNVATTLAIVFGSGLVFIAAIAVIMYCWKSSRQTTPGPVTHLPTAQQPYAAQYQNPGFNRGHQYPQTRQADAPSLSQSESMATPPQYSVNKM